jgi:tetratricopeptide (TPR) repeat protein
MSLSSAASYLLLSNPSLSIKYMAYTLNSTRDDCMIEQDFDRLDNMLQKQEFQELRTICNRLLTESSNSRFRVSWLQLLLGLADLAQSRFDHALEKFDLITELPAPLRARASAARNKTLALMGRRDEAYVNLLHLVDREPESWAAWEALGICERACGNQEQAWQAFTRALLINPSNVTVITALIEMGLSSKRHAELIAALDLHLSDEPMALGFRACLATCLFLCGDFVRARSEMQRIVAFAQFSVVDSEVISTMQEMLTKLNALQVGGK